jgi:hypothetical protein
MPLFRTEVTIAPSAVKMDYKTRFTTIGSCFSNSIGEKLTDNKFDCLINPFGTVFNPISIHQLVKLACDNKPPDENSYVFTEEVWRNYQLHSSFFSKVKTELEDKIKSTIVSVHDYLQTADYLIITYGTAFVYEKNDTKQLVANCHKQPNQFTKRLLTVEEIAESFKTMMEALHKINPGCKVILTVSPVRHLKDTLELNSVSKSVLRIASHQLVSSAVVYFPAYEFVLDDLRDYRFYEADMIHPSQQAIDYIWSKFSECYFTESTKNFIKQWKEIKAALNHRPFNPEGEAHRKFLQKILEKLFELNKITDLQKEIDQLQTLIANYEKR